MPYSLTHLGGECSVTGSAHLLQIKSGPIILVDCGLSMGNDPSVPFSEWPVEPADIDYLFLTHAHIDHIGRVPDLIDAGFTGEILCSHPTKALLVPMLHDAMGFSNRSKDEGRRLESVIEELSWGFEYQQSFRLNKGVRFKLGRAGHILGSCFIHFTIPGEPKPCRILFSGDLGCRNSPILCDPDPPDACDLLIMESTYGDRNHEARDDRIERLETALNRALADGGKVFIPAFSLGRTQELIYEIDRILSAQGLRDTAGQGSALQQIPVFVDSPLGLEITNIYSSLSEFWDQESKSLFKEGDHPIDFKTLFAVKSYRDHQKALTIPGPSVVIAGSGMCTGGRIIDHLEAGLADAKNDVFFVGYQAKGTLGRQILKYGPRANGYAWINGEKVYINAKLYKLGGYSAHADQHELVQWVEEMPEKPGMIKLVHGEEEARSALQKVLEDRGYRL
ncbi:MBL fold metallo-hydrolase [Desulfoluna spongiiphila]|uniref:Metallo-beta-lactamase family protein n=1 Tax=Desulfoluna spongiiphila TaxID=419481 RepID=A0A1G5D8I0_9BACT|nr:MBL fold metallo-hydrolase [Desulfoluna spongiiphila]SCY10847.1 metallo-beta-lactamase family protein [Desulfoluna spongiiphila]